MVIYYVLVNKPNTAFVPVINKKPSTKVLYKLKDNLINPY